MPAVRSSRTTGFLTVLAMLLGSLAVGVAHAARFAGPPEDYAPYQPQKRCVERARPGTRKLARWINRRFDGGPARATVRDCGSGGTSEHKDGRAIDWSMDARRAADRAEVDRFLRRLFRTDQEDHPHALARRMGVMYVIWNDHMYASYHQFAERDYRSSSCPRLRTCSPTLRHRDHVHLSLSHAGARARTSWYLPPPEPEPEPTADPEPTAEPEG